MMLEILFEDEWLLAVDKPAGLVVHPAYKNKSGTLLDIVRERDAAVVFSIVGRLDKLTSGIVLLAKSAAAHSALQRGWPRAEKDYLAVVRGRLDVAADVIDLPLGTDPTDRRRRIVRLDGAPSVTTFERIDYDASLNRSLLLCRLMTGRRHQIRVHLAARGWPVIGDALYGETHPESERHALHAWRLTFGHPVTGDIVRVRSVLPKALVSLYPNSDTVLR